MQSRMARVVTRGTIAAVLGGAAIGVVATSGTALADATTTVNLTANVAATGTPGIVSGAGFRPASVAAGGTTSMQMGTTQPANACRTTGDCPEGYPNWHADLTITGLQAAGLTFTGNGDTSAGCVQDTPDEVVCHYVYFNNYHKSDHFDFAVSPDATPGDYTVNVDLRVSNNAPTTKDDCKSGGWANYTAPTFDPTGALLSVGPMFTNQGHCVSSVVSNAATR